MKTHNFILGPVDTDSISFGKPDGASFSDQEQKDLLEEINSLLPSLIRYEHDGYFPTVICLKAKNYVLYDGVKIKKKGSSLKSATLEPVFKEFLDQMINCIISGDTNYASVYHKYVLEACNIKDIKRWASKKSLSATVFKSARANETKIVDTIKGTEYREGDKIYTIFMPDGSLKLIEHFTGEYDCDKMLSKLFECTKRFSTVLPAGLFLNYSLKRNKEALKKVLE